MSGVSKSLILILFWAFHLTVEVVLNQITTICHLLISFWLLTFLPFDFLLSFCRQSINTGRSICNLLFAWISFSCDERKSRCSMKVSGFLNEYYTLKIYITVYTSLFIFFLPLTVIELWYKKNSITAISSILHSMETSGEVTLSADPLTTLTISFTHCFWWFIDWMQWTYNE